MTSNRREPGLSVLMLGVCFLASGSTALVYELLWLRRLELIFGTTTYALTTTLAGFMTGLGLGAYWIGRRVDAGRRGLRTYALLELGLALYAAFSPWLLGWIEGAFASLQHGLQLQTAGATGLKLLLALPVLAIPAGLMGGTLPALVGALTARRSDLPGKMGWLYGINTLGAAAGALLTGLVLVELLGISRTVYVGAGINAAVGLLILSRLRRAARPPADPPAPQRETRLRDHLRTPEVLFCAVAVTLTGALSMSYQLCWTRVLALVLGRSTYTFTLVLAVFLLGIGGGALLYARRAARRPPTALGLVALLLALAAWVALSLAAIPLLPALLLGTAGGGGLSRILAVEGLLAAAVLLVPALLLGAALPMALGIAGRTLRQAGRDVGGIYLANTAGSITGALVVGFLLIPLLGTQRALLWGLAANLLLAGAGLLRFGAGRRRLAGGVLTAVIGALALATPAWPTEVFTAGLGYRLRQVRAPADAGAVIRRVPSRQLFLEEGVNSTVAVQQYRDGAVLMINGNPEASSVLDMGTQSLLGIVPLLLHPRPRRMAVVGWGAGVSAHTATFFPGLERLEVIEIEPAVVAASSHFHHVNGAVERHPRVRIVHDDARSRLLAHPGTYDVIVSQPSHPWAPGVAGLFSAGFHALVKARLRPGGLYAQWLQLYGLDARTVGLALRTFLTSFPHAQLWQTSRGNLLLVGSERRLRPSLERVARAYRQSPHIARQMAAFGPGPRPEHFFGCFLLDRARLEQLLPPGPLTTDDRPLLEYWSLRGLYGPPPAPIEDRLWRLKRQAELVLPPTVGQPPKAALVFAGAARLMRSTPAGELVTRWAMQRHPDDPDVRLARIRRLNRGRPYRTGQALALLARTAPTSAELGAELALERAVARLHAGRPAEALASLARMGRHRPATRLFYELRARVDAGQGARAWRTADQLLGLLERGAAWDARVISRRRVFGELLRRLIDRRAGLEGGAALALLGRRGARVDGEIDRLEQLLRVQLIRRRWRPAAATALRLRAFGFTGATLLGACDDVDAGARSACRRELGGALPGR